MKKVIDAVQLLEAKPFRFAKTMPAQAHWYTLRREWENSHEFSEVAQIVRDYGEDEVYYYRKYICFGANGQKYWTMGEEIEKTTLINRTTKQYRGPYDFHSATYDSWYERGEHKREEKALLDCLGNGFSDQKVLDIGCGTGWFLDHFHIEPEMYTGIDPSWGMLTQLVAKHPEFVNSLKCCSIRDFWPWEKGYDVVIAMGHSADYISPSDLEKIRFLTTEEAMFYGTCAIDAAYASDLFTEVFPDEKVLQPKVSKQIGMHHGLVAGKISEL
ncbi:MAG: class I SAM-dependent methyltransferase [Bacteroidetes bacterium]|nr:class I SAM-dependent methyltransferase [Bacteroidota bacterium]